jgi:beta-glucanase (GH16 family)
MKLVIQFLCHFLLFILLNGCSGKDNGQVDTPFPVHFNFLEDPSVYVIKWKDDFEILDPSNWTIGLKDPISGDMVPAQGGQYLLNSNYAGYITEEDSYVKDGALFLQNQKRSYSGTNPPGNYNYTSGWVMSMHKCFFNGSEKGIYLEVKARFPSGDKVWPAIWLIPESLTWPPEIDLWEYFGKFFEWDYDEMYMRYIHCHYTNPIEHNKKIMGFNQNYHSDQWHTYGFQWSSTNMIWSIDGIVVHTIEKGVQVDEIDWPKEYFYIVMNNGVLASVSDENTNWPNHLMIESIALYEVNE